LAQHFPEMPSLPRPRNPEYENRQINNPLTNTKTTHHKIQKKQQLQRNLGGKVRGNLAPKVLDETATDPGGQVSCQPLRETNKILTFKERLNQKETDPKRLHQRQKQVDFGKNTLGYDQYIKKVPKKNRKREDPKTPDISQMCSKRSWDAQIRKWRRLLHLWDPKGHLDNQEIVQNKEQMIQDCQQLEVLDKLLEEVKDKDIEEDNEETELTDLGPIENIPNWDIYSNWDD